MNTRSALYLLLVSTMLALCPAAHAKPDPNRVLESLQRTSDYKKLGHRARKKDLNKQKWVVPGSNLSSIFGRGGDASHLLQWLGTVGNPYSQGKQWLKNSVEFASAEVQYFNSHLKEVRLLVVAPHPKFRDAANFKLMEPFTSFEPPAFKPESEEEIDIRGFKGMMYVTTRGETSLIIRMDLGAVVQLKTASYSQKEDILGIAKLLDLERLNKKLNS